MQKHVLLGMALRHMHGLKDVCPNLLDCVFLTLYYSGFFKQSINQT